MKDEGCEINRELNKETIRRGSRRKKLFSIFAMFLFSLTFRQTVFMIQTETCLNPAENPLLPSKFVFI